MPLMATLCVTGKVCQACVYVCGNGVNKHIVGEVTEAKVKQRLQSIPPGCVCVCARLQAGVSAPPPSAALLLTPLPHLLASEG